jgi:hypothetical protein
METYLRCMTQSALAKWSKWLSLTEFWYNTTFHSALGKSPFLGALWVQTETLWHSGYLCPRLYCHT